MKSLYTWSLAIAAIVFEVASATRSTIATSEESTLLRKLLQDALKIQTTPESYNDIATDNGVFIPRLITNFPNNDYSVLQDPKKRRHAKRGLYHHRRPWYSTRKPTQPTGGNPCNFYTPLDRIGSNPLFGCKRRRAEMAAAQKKA